MNDHRVKNGDKRTVDIFKKIKKPDKTGIIIYKFNIEKAKKVKKIPLYGVFRMIKRKGERKRSVYLRKFKVFRYIEMNWVCFIAASCMS